MVPSLLASVVLLGGLLGLWAAQARSNRRAMLRRLEDRVSGALARGHVPFRDELHGEHHGRPICLRLSTRPWVPGGRTRYPLTVLLELRHAPDIRLRIRRDWGLAAIEKALGLARDVEVSGGDRFDELYLVETDGAPAGAPLADEGVREAVKAILVRWDLEEIRIKGGKLIVRGDSRWLGQTMLHELLFELEVLAHAYDRRPAPQIGKISPRFFWVGGADTAPRCPYCHDAIAQEEDLAACGVCSTLIHPECLAENGGCPILGCGGLGGLPARPLNIDKA